MGIEKYFSSYFIVLILAVGLYMQTIQGPDLIQINHLEREGKFSKRVGKVFVVVGITLLLLRLF